MSATKYSRYSAFTSTSLDVSYQFSPNGIIFEVYAVFNESKSWITKPTLVLLEHERGHFKITEIYARKLRQYFTSIEKDIIDENLIDKKIASLQKKRYEFQRYYDKITNHSLNSKMQKEFIILIDKELLSLKQFASPIDTEMP